MFKQITCLSDIATRKLNSLNTLAWHIDEPSVYNPPPCAKLFGNFVLQTSSTRSITIPPAEPHTNYDTDISSIIRVQPPQSSQC